MLAAAFFSVFLTVSAVEVDVPRNQGWITDLAGFLSASDEKALETLMDSYKRGSGQGIAVLTLPSLEGESIANVGLEVAREWRIGSADTNAGALLVIARDDREMRIETGRGLEGLLTDSICGRIIRDVIAPHFKRNDYSAGIRDGVLAMHAAAKGDYAAIERRGRSRGSGRQRLPDPDGHCVHHPRWAASRTGGRGGGGVALAGCQQPDVWASRRRLFERRRRGGGFSGFGGGGGFSGGGASGSW